MSGPLDRKAILLLLFGASLVGGGTVLVRLIGTGPAAAGWWRLAFALPWLAVLTGMERRRGGAGAAGERWRLGAPLPLLLLCGLTFALDLICWHSSLKLTSIATSTVLANLTPVIVTVLAWVLFRERPALAFLGGLAMALGGAAVMTLARSHAGGAGSAPLLGDAFAVGASFCYAFYFLTVRTVRRTASALQVMLASSLVGAPLVLIAALGLHERIWPVGLVGWGAGVALGLMHVGGQGAIAWSLGRVPTALAAVVVLVQPVVAALAGLLVFHEAVGAVQALGALLSLGGVAVAQIAARRMAPVEGEAEAAAAPA